MMLNDGHVAVFLELIRFRLSLVDHVPRDKLEPLDGSWEVIGEALSPDKIVLTGVLEGKCTPRHLRLICKALMARHFDFAYVQWPGDGTISAFADPVQGGDLDGWWCIDLVDLRIGKRRIKRNVDTLT